eukprot:GFKZ01001341.1.p1 GENE.GFKZ01001341.1~~GFKZ01001341.1.p1  ORF type:complete len:415 (+),score=39.58 GFKZ01001341.1:233-1477(+)
MFSPSSHLLFLSPSSFIPQNPISSHPARSNQLCTAPRISLAGRGPSSRRLSYLNRIRSNASNPTDNPAVPAAAVTSTSSKKSKTSLRVNFFGVTISIPGAFVLLVVPLLWSSYSICLKILFSLPWSFSAPVFNFLRLGIASIFALPDLILSLLRMRPSNPADRSPKRRQIILAGLELGFYTVTVNILQGIGLRYIPASRGSFLTQLSTVIVPLMAFASRIESSLTWKTIVASLMALGGVALLTLDGVSAAMSWKGDLCLLLTAFISATFVLRSKIHSGKQGPLVSLKVVSQTLFAMCFLAVGGVFRGSALPSMGTIFAGATPMMLGINFAIVVWAGLFVSFISTVLQMKGQQLVSASEASVIFSCTPLWASVLAIPLGERFGSKGIIGAALILVSTLMASVGGGGGKGQKKGGD